MRQYQSWRGAIFFLILTTSAAAGEEKPESFRQLRERIDRRVVEWQPSAEEKRFDQIGWCTSLFEAEKLARHHQRPIFLFTHDGRMNVGRC
jgi:hypothetical protein